MRRSGIDVAINMMCMNSRCKYYWEDNCTRNINEERIEIDENGKCETFELGESEWYIDSAYGEIDPFAIYPFKLYGSVLILDNEIQDSKLSTEKAEKIEDFHTIWQKERIQDYQIENFEFECINEDAIQKFKIELAKWISKWKYAENYRSMKA
jgi:hypothetical protein